MDNTSALTMGQIVSKFGIEIIDGKCCCPFHDDHHPSMIINDLTAYCFACSQLWTIERFVWQMLKNQGRHPTYDDVQAFLKQGNFPPYTPVRRGSAYTGAVPAPLIAYWYSQLSDDLRENLSRERLISLDSLRKYQIGWRKEMTAYVIPFWSDVIGHSPVDIVQFRRTDGKRPKYIGLRGHNRGAIMNQFLLRETQPYVVVLFGSLDPIAAYEDGIIAVGTNGSTAFSRREKERVQALFERQHTIFVVPDNTASEFSAAETFADWVGGDVRYFPHDMAPGTDYIDFRHQGGTPEQFKQDILGIEFTPVDTNILHNILESLRAGNRVNDVQNHLLSARGTPALSVSLAISKNGPLGLPISDWRELGKTLRRSVSVPQLELALQSISDRIYYKNGGW